MQGNMRVMDLWDRSDRSLTAEAERDYPGGTPPRNRPGGATYEEMERSLDGLRSYEYTVGGEVRKFYTIQAIATIFDRKTVTIRSWEDKGWLPRPKYRSPKPVRSTLAAEAKGRRLYSEDQVRYLMSLIERFNMRDQRRADWNSFREAMAEYPS